MDTAVLENPSVGKQGGGALSVSELRYAVKQVIENGSSLSAL